MTNTLHKNPNSNNQVGNKAIAITAVITVGIVALASVWVIGQSDCGARLHFRIWPSPDIRLEKLACPSR
ncbi:MAG: hypothetical protein V7L29_28825 [Nostoc sp.]|uniref:hypothetical protein n=1 Tax=Nostoc sp. TaxID=1180 RepID=UPI002FF823AB